MLNEEYGDAPYGVAQVAFADGTVLSRQQVVALAMAGTAGADTLYGSDGADTFDGLGAPAGVAGLRAGQRRGGHLRVQPGYGQLEVNEYVEEYTTGTATLQLGAGIAAASLTASRDGSGNVFLMDGVAGDRIELYGMLNLGYGGYVQYGVAQVALADGTALSRQQVIALTMTGTAGADTLYGTSGADTLDGKGAPAGSQDYEQGGGGADTFVFDPGYGQLEVNEDAGYYTTSTATLRLGAGITAASLGASRDGSGNLFLTDGAAGDQIEIDGMFNPGYFGYAQYGVAQVQLADGTVLGRQQLAALAMTGTAGVDFLYGTAGADTLDGLGAPAGSQDYEQGGGGADTFVFNPGYGGLEISEDAGYYNDSAAVLQLGGGDRRGQPGRHPGPGG